MVSNKLGVLIFVTRVLFPRGEKLHFGHIIKNNSFNLGSNKELVNFLDISKHNKLDFFCEFNTKAGISNFNKSLVYAFTKSRVEFKDGKFFENLTNLLYLFLRYLKHLMIYLS